MMGMQEDSKLYHQGKGNKAPEEGVTDSKINSIRQVLVRVQYYPRILVREIREAGSREVTSNKFSSNSFNR